MFAIIIGGALAGLLGAILALPVAAACRDVVRYLFRRLSPDDAARPSRLDRRARARTSILGVPGPAAAPAEMAMPDGSTRTRSSRSIPRRRTRSSQAAYRRLARKYHPDTAAGPEAAARMAAINAAWELIGEPERACGVRPRAGTGPPRLARTRLAPRPAPARPAPACPAEPTRRRRSARHAEPPAGDRCRATGPRPLVGGRRVRPVDAAPDGTGAAGPPPGDPSGSVLNFGRYAGWSLGEIARRTSSTSSGSTGCRSAAHTATRSTRSSAQAGRRQSAAADASERRGLFRRR